MHVAPEFVIWDFNGTILDDVTLAAASISELLRRRDLPCLDTSTYRQLFGFPVSEYFERVGFDLSVEDFTELSDEFHESYLAGVDACSLNDGVMELLESFQRSGVTQFILSAAEQNLLESWVRAREIESFFRGIYGLADKLARGKTDRGMELLRAHNVAPSRTLLIGDTDHDVEVANALGAHPVVVLQGHQDRARFDSHACDVYENFAALRREFPSSMQAPSSLSHNSTGASAANSGRASA